MGSGSSSSGWSRTKPWEGQQEYLRNLYSQAQQVYQGNQYQYYPGSTVAGFNQASQQGFQQAEQRGMAGSPLNRAAQGHAQDTIEGKYLDPESNPNLQRYGDIGARGMRRNYYDAVNSLGSRMEASGRTGGGAHATGSNVTDENFATGLGDMYARLYGGAYEGERGRMMGASKMAPALAETDYRDASALRNVGAQREQMAQNQLNDLVARFNFNQYEPAQRLSQFAQHLGAPVMEQAGQDRSSSISVFK